MHNSVKCYIVNRPLGRSIHHARPVAIDDSHGHLRQPAALSPVHPPSVKQEIRKGQMLKLRGDRVLEVLYTESRSPLSRQINPLISLFKCELDLTRAARTPPVPS